MATTQGALILRHIRKLVAAQCPSQQSDVQLLQQFIADRDEAAFAAIVQRHGTMVLSVCRNVLRHQQDAEDAFQAAFLVLARKAHTVRKHEALSSWLHGVAYRLSLKARAHGIHRRTDDQTPPDPFVSSPVDDITMRELRGILHEELDRLGDQYRTPLLLCYWEGKTRDEAAEQLGMTSDAFKKRLERARNLLGSRLVRRGLVPSAAFFATLFSANGVQAALPMVLINTTAQAAVAFAAGKTVGVSAASAALANGVIQVMNITKWASAVLVIVLLGGLTTGLGIGGYQLVKGDPVDAGIVAAGAGEKQPAKEKAKDAPMTDKERIVGIWRITKGMANGEELMPKDFIALARFTFTKDGKFTITSLEGTAKKGKYEIVGSGKLDFGVGMSDKDVANGIYEFDGNDRLTLCASNEPKKRPTEFKADKGSNNVYFSLVRTKPGEETPEQIAKDKPAIDKIREAASRQVSANNLKQIALAMHNHHDQSGSLPAHAIYSKDGKTPLLSWRVAILPYIDQQFLYKEFKLDEPWDSEHNKKLIPKMPKTYTPGSAGKAKEGETYYQVFTGPDTVFDGAKKMKLTDITDGTSNTALAVEAKDAVIWTKPADLVVPKDKDKRLPVGGLFSNGFHVMMCDGSVRMLPLEVPVATLRSLVTPKAGD